MKHDRNTWLLLLGLVAVVLVLDQGSKLWVHTTFGLYEARTIVPDFFHLTYVRNSGAAFGMLARQHPAFLRFFFPTVTILAVLVLLIYYTRVPREQALTRWGIGLIIGGAVGNGIDRLWLGQVIDFIDVHVYDYHWPAFNLADSAICVGVGLLLLNALRRPA